MKASAAPAPTWASSPEGWTVASALPPIRMASPFRPHLRGGRTMASQEDVDRISAMASETEDVVKLKEYRQELADIAATMQRIFDGSNDPEMREEVAQIKESAEYEAEEISRRARQLEIDQMDPDYERRKAEREAFEAERKQKEQQEAQAGLKQLSGLLGGLMGGKGGGEEGGGGLGALGGMFGWGGSKRARDRTIRKQRRLRGRPRRPRRSQAGGRGRSRPGPARPLPPLWLRRQRP